ncbi:hypothetical protein Daus18300_009387 [Diaporthe australafricana]|uniref:Uncharacterized protein n=1 Tax=Diaporthe australafricana TaxID=127596 RepID=A0ABR3WES3_9PEZI
MGWVWVRPECYDKELMDDFMNRTEFSWHTEPKLHPESMVPLDVIFRGDHPKLFTQKKYHYVHCTVNLKENGGLLDEVIFVVNTENTEDLDYLNELVPSQKQYQTLVPDTTQRQSKQDFSYLWAAVTEREAVYVKIDDDVVGSQPE